MVICLCGCSTEYKQGTLSTAGRLLLIEGRKRREQTGQVIKERLESQRKKSQEHEQQPERILNPDGDADQKKRDLLAEKRMQLFLR